MELLPVMKWVGGKRQLLDSIKANLPQDFKDRPYYEAFVGGGAVVFGLTPDNAVINDFNEELVNLYKVIKRSPRKLIEELESGTYQNTPEVFYAIRAWDKEDDFKDRSDVQRAARTLYLNHTCFNGLYRVNGQGFFNTPYGKYKNPKIYVEENIMNLHRYLKSVKIYCGDYYRILEMAESGSFVYLDPPYAPLSATSSFTAYVAGGWDNAEQVRLKEACDELNARGVLFMQSNSSAPLIRDLYRDYNIIEVEASRAISATTDGRKKVTELIITNY